MRSWLENAWPLACLTYAVTANAVSPTLAYIILLLYAAPLLDSGEVHDRRVRWRDTLVVPLVVLTGHLPVAGAAFSYGPSVLAVVFATVSGVVEEIFFRGFLLRREGLLMQAFIFALTHLSLFDPVSLVLSALLWPHYFVLGLTFGVIAKSKSWHLSAAAHAAYNAAATTYGLAVEPGVVATLLAADLLSMSFVAFYFYALE